MEKETDLAATNGGRQSSKGRRSFLLCEILRINVCLTALLVDCAWFPWCFSCNCFLYFFSETFFSVSAILTVDKELKLKSFNCLINMFYLLLYLPDNMSRLSH